jgi:hypothetical protein
LVAINRRRRRVWVDGVGYDTETDAARAAGVAVSSVYAALAAGGREVKGRMVSPEAPPAPRRTEPVAVRKTGILLRYPPGEGPLYGRSPRWR